MNTYPPEGVGIISFVFCALSILTLFRFFGENGLILYSVVALLAANLQVLKAGQYSFFDQPVVLGTLVFSSIFLVMDMLTEYYGPHAARRAVWLSFSGCILMTGLMTLTLGVRPLDLSPHSPYLSFNTAHQAISVLFLPAPAIFAASLLSYIISQYTDIWIYQCIKTLTQARALWLRTTLSNILASLLDNIIFSTLAWVVFAPSPVDFNTLVYSYILGTYCFRLLASLANAPVMYLSRSLARTKKNMNVTLSAL
jgi:queuosine precursor transporter